MKKKLKAKDLLYEILFMMTQRSKCPKVKEYDTNNFELSAPHFGLYEEEI